METETREKSLEETTYGSTSTLRHSRRSKRQRGRLGIGQTDAVTLTDLDEYLQTKSTPAALAAQTKPKRAVAK